MEEIKTRSTGGKIEGHEEILRIVFLKKKMTIGPITPSPSITDIQSIFKENVKKTMG